MRRATMPIFVPLLLGYARGEGVDADELLRRFSLPPEFDGLTKVEVDLTRVNALIEATANALRDPFLGIHVAVRCRRGAYEFVEFACRNSPDLRGAILRLVRYAALVNPAVEFSFTETDRGGALSHHFDGLGRHANEFTVALLYLFGREVTREPWTPETVWFAHEAPDDTSELVSFFATERLRFGEDSNGLLITRGALEKPLVGADPALLRVLETKMVREIPPSAAARPSASAGASEIVADTERAVRQTLELGAARIESVAESLGMSVRSLQRRLDEEGTTFHGLLERTREQLARHHVERGELSSAQIAFVTGYSDVRAFLRAFKRWTGTSPQEFRTGDRAATAKPKKRAR